MSERMYTPWGKADRVETLLDTPEGSIDVVRTPSHGGMRISKGLLPAKIVDSFSTESGEKYCWAEEDEDETKVLKYLLNSEAVDEVNWRKVYAYSPQILQNHIDNIYRYKPENQKLHVYVNSDRIGVLKDGYGNWVVMLATTICDYDREVLVRYIPDEDLEDEDKLDFTSTGSELMSVRAYHYPSSFGQKSDSLKAAFNAAEVEAARLRMDMAGEVFLAYPPYYQTHN